MGLGSSLPWEMHRQSEQGDGETVSWKVPAGTLQDSLVKNVGVTVTG